MITITKVYIRKYLQNTEIMNKGYCCTLYEFNSNFLHCHRTVRYNLQNVKH